VTAFSVSDDRVPGQNVRVEILLDHRKSRDRQRLSARRSASTSQLATAAGAYPLKVEPVGVRARKVQAPQKWALAG